MIQFPFFHHSRRDSPCHKMQGLWLWVKLRALQSVWQGYTTSCLPLSGVSEARLEVGSIVVGYFMCLPHGLRDMCMISLGNWSIKITWTVTSCQSEAGKNTWTSIVLKFFCKLAQLCVGSRQRNDVTRSIFCPIFRKLVTSILDLDLMNLFLKPVLGSTP